MRTYTQTMNTHCCVSDSVAHIITLHYSLHLPVFLTRVSWPVVCFRACVFQKCKISTGACDRPYKREGEKSTKKGSRSQRREKEETKAEATNMSTGEEASLKGVSIDRVDDG